MEIKKQLLADLANDDFSHYQMAKLEESCSKWLWLIKVQGKTANNNTRILIYSILHFCYDVKEYMDAIQPITTEDHEKIEQIVVTPLREAINVIEKGDAQSHLDVIAGLIDTEVKMREIGKSA